MLTRTHTPLRWRSVLRLALKAAFYLSTRRGVALSVSQMRKKRPRHVAPRALFFAQRSEIITLPKKNIIRDVISQLPVIALRVFVFNCEAKKLDQSETFLAVFMQNRPHRRLQAGDSRFGRIYSVLSALSLFARRVCALFDSQHAHAMAFVGLNASLFV